MAGELTFSGQVTAAKGRVWEASELETRRAMMRNTLENLRVGPGHRVAVAIGEDVGFMTAVAAIRDTGAVAALISSRPAGALRDAPRVRELLVDAVPDVTILDDAHGKAFSNLPGAIIRVAPSAELALAGTPPVDGPRAPVDAAI